MNRGPLPIPLRDRLRHASVCASLLVLAGCSGSGGGRPTPTRTNTTAELAPTIGIGVGLWTLDDWPSDVIPGAAGSVGAPSVRAPAAPGRETTEQVLARLGTPNPPVPDATIAAWRDAGFALHVIPSDKLPELRESLPLSGAAKNQQLQFSATWAQLVQGATARARMTVGIGGGSYQIDRGGFEMLVRSWPVPTLATPAQQHGSGDSHDTAMDRDAVRALAQIELVPRLQPVGSGGVERRLALNQEGELVALEPRERQLFDRLVCAITLGKNQAVVIYPMRTTEQSSGAPSVEPAVANALVSDVAPSVAPPVVQDADELLGDGGAAQDVPTAPRIRTDAPAKGKNAPLGPEIPDPPTLGESLLSDALSPPRNGTRLMVVIVASPPSEYKLLPN